MEDIFLPGTIIGEAGILKRQNRAASIKCETLVHAYHISSLTMTEAVKLFSSLFNSLESKLWKSWGMKVASMVMKTNAQHQVSTHFANKRFRISIYGRYLHSVNPTLSRHGVPTN